jgi:hypothetical protein
MIAHKAAEPTVAQLSKHPLNQAALMVLQRSGTRRTSLPPDLMPVLVLATSELMEANELDNRLQALSQWSASLQQQQAALAILAKVLEPAELLSGTPLETAEQIANELVSEAATREVD